MQSIKKKEKSSISISKVRMKVMFNQVLAMSICSVVEHASENHKCISKKFYTQLKLSQSATAFDVRFDLRTFITYNSNEWLTHICEWIARRNTKILRRFMMMVHWSHRRLKWVRDKNNNNRTIGWYHCFVSFFPSKFNKMIHVYAL